MPEIGEPARQTMQLCLLCTLHLIMIVVFGWDVLMVTTGHAGDTVSSILRQWSRQYPEVLLLVGYLICHLFGR